MNQNPHLAALSAAGVSVWLDDLSRDLLESGTLQQLIDSRSVVGVTSNRSTFERALTHSHAYDDQIAALGAPGADSDTAICAIITDDVRAACDVLRPQWQASDGVDGRVSIEIDPRAAHNTDRTVAQARELAQLVERPNLLVKIPATAAGIPAISAVLAQGVSVNVTLIFSVQRYCAVMKAYLAGLEAVRKAGQDVSEIHSVAAVFVYRVDTEVDKRLATIGTGEALRLRGQAGIANARLAYAAYQQVFERDPRFAGFAPAGARAQRPLWASTGVKDPSYPDTVYISELIAPQTVTTIPQTTLEAFADHGVVHRDTISGTAEQAQAVLEQLRQAGVDLYDVFATLEKDGVAKFAASWQHSLRR